MFVLACLCALGSDCKWKEIVNKFGNDKQNPDMLSVTVTVEHMHAGYYSYVQSNAILEILQT